MRTVRTVSIIALIALFPALAAAQTKAQRITVPKGTEIQAQSVYGVSSNDVHVGDAISLDVLDDVKIGAVTVIPRGAVVMGRVTAAKGARKIGRGGKLDATFQTVTALDGTKIPVEGTLSDKGRGGYGGGSAAGAAAAGLLFPPAGALLLLKHGHPAEIPAGAIFTVEVAQDTSVSIVAPAAQAVAETAAKPAATREVCRALVSGENNFLAPDETYVAATAMHGPMACRTVGGRTP